MDSLQGDTEDSRTCEVGRKRDSAEVALPQGPSSDYSDDSVERSQKRIKQDRTVADSERIANGVIANTSSQSPADSSPAEIPRVYLDKQQTIPAPLPMTWNKGVQSGLRTSFGSRSSRASAPVHNYDEGSKTRVGIDVNPQDDVIADAPQPGLDSGSGSNHQEAVDTNQPAEPDAEELENTKPKSKRAQKRKRQGLESDTAGVKGAKGNNSSPNLEPQSQADPQLPRPLLPGAKGVYENGQGVFELSEILHDNQPIPLQELTLDVFVNHFLKINAEKLDGLTAKHVKGAFNAYIGVYYGHLRPQVLESVRAISATEPARKFCSDSLTQARKAATKKAKVVKSKSLSKTQPDFPGSAHGGLDALPNGSENVASTMSQPPPEVAHEVLSGSDTGQTFNTKDSEDFVALVSAQLEREDGEMSSSAEESFDIALSDLEIELLQKYFPAVSGIVARPRCLACASSAHKTYDCPALTCDICGGNHSAFACPTNQRCGKCRARGHQTRECPEKLFLARSEAGGCDLCHSQDHLEDACHLIWRTFNPKPEEIRTVRDIPVSCYVCGASNHYGPECGLHSGKIVSGGRTWSKFNLQKYLDPSSSDRAISAGTDYSLQNLPRKGFSIKGKANDPIPLDDSDSEAEFIRPSVKPSSTKGQQSGGSQQILFAQNRTFGQESSNGPSSQRANKFPRQARPRFGDNNDLQDSARYGRERTFSPPRYDDFRASFPENDRYAPQAPARRDYRPANNDFRAGKSGNGRGGGARGGSNARGKRRARGSK